ncbi:DUF3999 family protein [Saccharibacillus sp. CPCC 101409]|uniref:DUF3999 family protein n=1 Tax=Saccharibacillus sp. CPCC 101409 TaxID=3058041 RepID=UPI002671BC41|nr:DUF3999 family protein [Saccharibacillus sp. CPCC 101409]MDO3409989.1 DUF3999 family protein [Saccharibacillus sp. CPCC 101409]
MRNPKHAAQIWAERTAEAALKSNPRPQERRKRSIQRFLRFGTAICALTLALAPAAARESPASASGAPAPGPTGALWPFAKDITTAEGSAYQAVFLDEDVYARAQENLEDVRVVNASGEWVPYYIESGGEDERGPERSYRMERVDRADSEDRSRFDFRVVPEAENEDVVGSRIVFELPNRSFLKTVTLEGSYDGRRWEQAAEGELYRAEDGVSRDVIEAGRPLKYGYYRLTVPNNAEDLDFAAATLEDNGVPLRGEQYLRTKELPFNVEPALTMSRVVLYNADRLKIDRIVVNAEASDGSSGFSRLFGIEPTPSRSADVLSPSRLNRLELDGSRIDDTEILLAEPIRNPKPTIVIDNGGNPPLDIQSIEVGYRVDRIVFEDTGAGPYRLVYGAEGQELPRYDIADFRAQIERDGPVQASLGKESAEAFTPADSRPGTDPSGGARVGAKASLQILFNIVIVAVALLLIVLVGRKMRKR